MQHVAAPPEAQSLTRPAFVLVGAAGCFPLRAGEQTIGRSSDCTISIPDETISRVHARIAVIDGRVTVQDLGSRNGVRVEEAVVTEAELPILSRVQFGSVTLQLICRPEGGNWSDSDLETAPLRGAIPRPEGISPAEHRVLIFMLDGLSEKAIAARLNLSQNTVHNHIRRIYRVLKISSRAEIVRLFLPSKGDEPRS
jgi:DNA-binding CsgD family transcriptional regulator